MADNVKNKCMDSEKAALGRKLLNKHQKSKSTRGNTNGKSTPQSETQQELQTVMPIQQYFNSPMERSIPVEGDLSFFDFDKVTIDDPELKHNELYNLHRINEVNVESNDIINTQTNEQRYMEEPAVSNVAETSPSYDDLQYTPSKSVKDAKLEIDSLQSQLQAQILTNSQLLGENSELQGKLQHVDNLCTDHSNEIVQLKQHLESSETRLAEYQRQIETSRRSAEDWHAKRQEEELVLISARKERDAALQDSSELLEKLNHAQKDGERVKQVISQLREQLDMSNIRIQQLANTNNVKITSEASAEKCTQLDKQLADMQVAIESVRSERDVAAQQYQQYTSQLNEQMAAQQADVLSLRNSNHQLMGRERDLVAHIGDMERLLQSAGNRKTADAQTTTGSDIDVAAENDLLECNQLQRRLEETRAERDEALRELQQLHAAAHEWEELRNTQQVDRMAQVKLLEEIRSDKVAASRAIEQNLSLKRQVAEMEAAYLSVTQDKVAPLTDQLATAKHQLLVYERNVRTLQDAIAIKDRELEQLRVCEAQLNDQLRNCDGHGHAAPSTPAHVLLSEHGDCGGTAEGADTRCKHCGGAEEDELQREIFQLKQQLDEMRQIGVDLAVVEEEEPGGVDLEVGGDGVGGEGRVQTRRLSKATATQQLERKFTRTMGELAALNDEKQRLEHLVLQLQGETETIGEYVALYQRQRSLLAQRTAARETQLRQLQRRLDELVGALGGGNGGSTGTREIDDRVVALLHEISRSNVDLLQHGAEGDVLVGGVGGVGGVTVECGRGCAWCQGEMMTV